MLDPKMNQSERTEGEGATFTDTKPEMVLDKTLIEEAPESRGKPGLWAAQVSDIGVIRQRNEDSCLVYSSESGGHFPLLPFGLYVVADGMGGHEAGHLASSTAARAAAYHVLKEVGLPLLEVADPPNHDALVQITEDAVHVAHEAIYNPDPVHDGGTTLTLALVLGQELYVAHVGDSRAYWLVDGKLQSVTNDHSLVQRLQDEGQLTAEEAEAYEYRNVLLRALGQQDELEVDTYQRSLPQNGKLLLCSDGLCGLVKHGELERIMNLPLPPLETAERLIAAAINAGGYDNITAVVVEFCF